MPLCLSLQYGGLYVMWRETVVYLWVKFVTVCSAMDTHGNIYALNMVICMCLNRGREAPAKIFAPSLIPAIVMHAMLSCVKASKQPSNKQTSTWRTKTRQAQLEASFNADDLLRWGAELFALLHDEVRTGGGVLQPRVYLLVPLIVFHDNLRLCWQPVWSMSGLQLSATATVFQHFNDKP